MLEKFLKIKKNIISLIIIFSILLIIMKIIYSQDNKIKLLNKATEISTKIDKKYNEKFVSISGKLKTEDMIKDKYLKSDCKYIKLFRKTEMYSWYRESVGGRKVYKRGWSEFPEKADNSINDIYINPDKKIKNVEYSAKFVSIGEYNVSGGGMEVINPEPISITNLQMIPENTGTDGEYIYLKKGSIISPDLGDIRIRYFALMEEDNVVVFGEVKENEIIPYDKKSQKLFLVYSGTKDEAVQFLKNENKKKNKKIRILL